MTTSPPRRCNTVAEVNARRSPPRDIERYGLRSQRAGAGARGGRQFPIQGDLTLRAGEDSRPLIGAGLWLSRLARRLQSGRLDAYMAYMLLAVLAVVINDGITEASNSEITGGSGARMAGSGGRYGRSPAGGCT